MAGTVEAATVYLGLGSNLGDRAAMMRAAVAALDQYAGVRMDAPGAVACLYETGPVGGPPGQPPYLNSAVRVVTTLPPVELLNAVLSIETSLGRVRHGHWEARSIDIDVLLYGDLVVRDATLTLPHPHLHERLFVLEPLSEIAGNVPHPVMKQTITELARRCRSRDERQPIERLSGPTWPLDPNCADRTGRHTAPQDA